MARPKGSKNKVQKYTSNPYYIYFRDVVHRGKSVGCDFEYKEEDFNRWLEIMGPIPENMQKATVGRYDHSKGYIYDYSKERWNFRWQEHSENSSEGGISRMANLSPEEKSDLSRRGIKAALANGNHSSQTGKAGLFHLTTEERSLNQKAAMASRTKEERSRIASAGGNALAEKRLTWTKNKSREVHESQSSGQILRWEDSSVEDRKEHTRAGREAASKSPSQLLNVELTCPNCGHRGTGPVMKRWHFDNCWLKPVSCTCCCEGNNAKSVSKSEISKEFLDKLSEI